MKEYSPQKDSTIDFDGRRLNIIFFFHCGFPIIEQVNDSLTQEGLTEEYKDNDKLLNILADYLYQ